MKRRPEDVSVYKKRLFDFNQAAHTTPFWIFDISERYAIAFDLTNSPTFVTLTLMTITHRRLVPFLLLFVYGTGLFLVAPHTDLDFVTGSGNVQLATHADADNCKHIPISNLDSCPLCSSVAGKAILTTAPFALDVINAAPVLQISSFPSPNSSAFLASISRRGPPSIPSL